MKSRSKRTDKPLLRRARVFARWLVRLRGSPRAIAGGVAVGMVVAFTPTIGFQMALALSLATALGANRPVSVVPTWITNPVTIPPIFAFTYWIGLWFWPGPPASEVADSLRDIAGEIAHLDSWSMREAASAFVALGADTLGAMTIGGLLVGGVAAAISYPITLWVVTDLRSRAARRRRKRN